MNDANIYITFVIHVIAGKLGAADALMRTYKTNILRVAAKLAQQAPITPMQLYRGLLLDPKIGLRKVPYTFVSWSEDLDVARWFASPQTEIGSYVGQLKPHYRGYLITREPAQPSQLVFHHSWGALFPFEAAALIHPDFDIELARQVHWNLNTQREVVTLPLDEDPMPLAVDVLNTSQLDDRFVPPWHAGKGL